LKDFVTRFINDSYKLTIMNLKTLLKRGCFLFIVITILSLKSHAGIPLPVSQQFEGNSLGSWTQTSISGTSVWFASTYNSNGYAGFNSTSQVNEDWLVSTEIDLNSVQPIKLSFDMIYRYGTDAANILTLWISTNYTGNVTTATWTQLNFTKPAAATAWSDPYTPIGNLDITSFKNQQVYFAFKSTSNGTSNATRNWRVDNFSVFKEGMAVYAVPFTKDFEDGSLGNFSSLNISAPNQWAYKSDALGKYASIGGNNTGTSGKDWLISPALNLNVADNFEMTFRSGSKFGTSTASKLTVWVSKNYRGIFNEAIWTQVNYKEPTTNDYVWYGSGYIDLSAYQGDTIHIGFKSSTDGSSNATRVFNVDDIKITKRPTLAEIPYNQSFDIGTLADWASIRVSGNTANNLWYYNLNSGSKVAKIQGNANEGVVAENWLVSPVINLDYKQQSTLDFKVATRYGTNAAGSLVVMISENYTGNVTTATWQNLSYTYPNTADFVFYPSGLINLDAYKGKRITIAFKTLHNGTSSASRNYLIDSITIKEKPLIITPSYETEFKPEEDSLRYWTTINNSSTTNKWAYHPYGFAQVAGNTTAVSENWLVSPQINLAITDDVLLSFISSYQGGDSSANNLSLWVSSNFTGNVTTANWTELSFIKPNTGNYTWINSGNVNLAAYKGNTVHIAFKATAQGTTSSDRIFGIDNLSLLSTTAASGGTDELETQVPSAWTTTAGSTLSISNDHYKKGSQSLQWNWLQNATITVNSPTNIADALTGLRGGMVLWIYNTAATTDSLTFQYSSNTQVEYEFTYRLNFKGWRPCWVRFDEDMWGPKSSNNIINMKIKAPTNTASGTLFFDKIEFGTFGRNAAKGYDGQSALLAADNQMPFISTNLGNDWLKLYYWSQLTPDIPLVSPLTSSEIASFDSISNRFISEFLGEGSPTATEVQNAKNSFNSLGIVRNGNNIKGKPVFATKDYVLEPTSPGYDPNVVSQKFLDDISLILARHYKYTANLESKQMYIDLVTHFLDQGFAKGSNVGTLSHTGYAYTKFPRSFVIMKDELIEANLFEDVKNSVIWLTGTAAFWDPPVIPGDNIDLLNTTLLARLASIVLLENNSEKAQWLKGLNRWTNNALAISPGTLDAFKVDGSLFHHNGFYPAYGTGALNSLGQFFYIIRNTDFAPSADKQANVRNAMYGVNVYSNKQWGMAISGRHPLDNSGVIQLQTGFKKMALAGDPLNGSPIDSLLAKAYVRIWGADAQINVSPESSPSGNWTYNYGALNIHRRDNWMATIKGYNQFVWSSEVYSEENRYGRYLSYGSVQVLDSSGNAGSGFNEYGWDWNNIPGTTIIHLPIDKLESPLAGSFQERSSEPFGGAISFQGHGALGVSLKENDRVNFDENFVAKKSVFSFDNRIICLGSGIRNNTLAHPTQTVLYQSKLTTTNMPVWVNNTTQETAFPYSNTINSTSSSWLVDAYKNGYYLPSGQTIKVQRNKQQGKHKDTKLFTEGDFSSAWIDHGTAPRNASYEYAMLINTNAAGMQQFNDSMQNESSAFYKVYQKDEKAHIVKDKPSGIFGYVLFVANSNITHGDLRSVDHYCIAMVRNTGSQMKLSVANPDLNVPTFTGSSTSQPSQLVKINIVLAGEWEAQGSPVKYAILSNTDSTVIEFDCKDGLSVEATLIPKQQPPSAFVKTEIKEEVKISDEIESGKSFAVYPNPVATTLNVNLTENEDGPVELFIYDMSGRLITASQFNAVKGVNIFSLSVAKLPDGIYMVQAKKGTKVRNRKFVKK
jgi:chondroitin-sulfate-ABC endolyase/exolyase